MKTLISPEQRLEWLALMPCLDLPEDFLKIIGETKPTVIEAENGSQYLAICKLQDEGRLIIRGVTVGKKGCDSTRIFSVDYPEPEQRNFDL